MCVHTYGDTSPVYSTDIRTELERSVSHSASSRTRADARFSLNTFYLRPWPHTSRTPFSSDSSPCVPRVLLHPTRSSALRSRKLEFPREGNIRLTPGGRGEILLGFLNTCENYAFNCVPLRVNRDMLNKFHFLLAEKKERKKGKKT